MSLFGDIFSTGPAQAAAQAQTAGINAGLQQANIFGAQGLNSVANWANTGLGDLSNYTGQGANAVGNYVGTGAGGLGNYVGQGANALAGYGNAGQNVLGGYVGQGANALNQYLSSALQPSLYNWGGVAQPGTTALGNALGLNGAQGNIASTQAFWNNPAIQSQLNLGTQNVMRGAAQAGGGNLSGATLGALQNLGQQTASQGWNNYLSNLNPYLNFSQGTAGNIGQYGTQAGTTAANLFGGASNTGANLYGTVGSNLGSLYGGGGNTFASLYGGGGNALSSLYGGAGSNSISATNNAANNSTNLYNMLAGVNYGGQTSIGNANANADLSAYNASANLWGGLLGGAKLATGNAGLFGSQGLIPGIQGLISSDERIKEDIKEVGKLFDGQPVYRFRYKGMPRTHIGLMAQDVEQSSPDAVTEVGGLKLVNYGMATDRAAVLSDWMQRAGEMRAV
jgi:Chaperone of endosialidase